MKPEEAKDILSDMRDRRLVFLGDSEIKEEWQKEYLKEAWACDSGAKASDKQIPRKPIIYPGTNRADCPVCMKTVRGIGKPFGKYCAGCGQKLDWGEEDDR